jgi:hypothetical protein
MNSDLSSLASTAATTIVQLLTTEGWERLKSALSPTFRGSRPGAEAALNAQLDDSHAELIAAGEDLDQVQEELTAEWRGRVRRLLAADPAIAVELRRLLDEELGPALSEAYPDRPNISMSAVASGKGRVYQAGRDITITER